MLTQFLQGDPHTNLVMRKREVSLRSFDSTHYYRIHIDKLTVYSSPDHFETFLHVLRLTTRGNFLLLEIQHTPGTLHKILSGFLNHLAKLTQRKPTFHLKRVDNDFLNHMNASHKAGILSPVYRQWNNCGKVKMKKRILTKKVPEVNKKENINIYFCVAQQGYLPRLTTV